MSAATKTMPENLYEAASFELNQFRERRMAERRMTQRDTPDRRVTGDDVPESAMNARKNQAIHHPPGRA
jgi:hypothetical protein